MDTKPGSPGEVILVQRGMTSEAKIIVIPASMPLEMSAYQKSRITSLAGTQLGVGAQCMIMNTAAFVWGTKLTMFVVPEILCRILVNIS